MATAPAEALQEAENDVQDIQIDVEAEARKMGWRPIEEMGERFDPARFVDAETFYNRGKEMLPVLKAANKALERKVSSMEKDLKRMSAFVTTAEKRGYEQAMEKIRAEQEAAVESGDVEAHRRAAKKADDLQKEMEESGKADNDDDDAAQRAEEFADWGKANKWYATNSVMQAYANSQAEIMARKKGGFLERADLDTLAEKVREKFEDEFPEAFAKEQTRQKRPHVEGGGTRQPTRGGKTYADLPHDAKAMCDKWVKQGLMTQADYVKNYQWS